MVVFYSALGLGIALILLSLVVGEILDFLNVFDGAISGTALGSGLTLFGASGVIVLSNDGRVWLAYALAGALGLVAVIATGQLTKTLVASSVQPTYEVLGLEGIAVTGINASHGEVQLSHTRELNKRLAFSDTDIPAGSQIVVAAVHGSRVKVTLFQPSTKETSK